MHIRTGCAVNHENVKQRVFLLIFPLTKLRSGLRGCRINFKSILCCFSLRAKGKAARIFFNKNDIYPVLFVSPIYIPTIGRSKFGTFLSLRISANLPPFLLIDIHSYLFERSPLIKSIVTFSFPPKNFGG